MNQQLKPHVPTLASELEDGIIELAGGKSMAHHVGMSEIVSRLETDDLQVQTDLYNSLMDREGEELISSLRHRATMMRQRADELDGIADGMTKFKADLHNKVLTFYTTVSDTQAALETLSHIKPARVTNGDKG